MSSSATNPLTEQLLRNILALPAKASLTDKEQTIRTVRGAVIVCIRYALASLQAAGFGQGASEQCIEEVLLSKLAAMGQAGDISDILGSTTLQKILKLLQGQSMVDKVGLKRFPPDPVCTLPTRYVSTDVARTVLANQEAACAAEATGNETGLALPSQEVNTLLAIMEVESLEDHHGATPNDVFTYLQSISGVKSKSKLLGKKLISSLLEALAQDPSGAAGVRQAFCQTMSQAHEATGPTCFRAAVRYRLQVSDATDPAPTREGFEKAVRLLEDVSKKPGTVLVAQVPEVEATAAVPGPSAAGGAPVMNGGGGNPAAALQTIKGQTLGQERAADSEPAGGPSASRPSSGAAAAAAAAGGGPGPTTGKQGGAGASGAGAGGSSADRLAPYPTPGWKWLEKPVARALTFSSDASMSPCTCYIVSLGSAGAGMRQPTQPPPPQPRAQPAAPPRPAKNLAPGPVLFSRPTLMPAQPGRPVNPAPTALPSAALAPSVRPGPSDDRLDPGPQRSAAAPRSMEGTPGPAVGTKRPASSAPRAAADIARAAGSVSAGQSPAGQGSVVAAVEGPDGAASKRQRVGEAPAREGMAPRLLLPEGQDADGGPKLLVEGFQLESWDFAV